MDRHCLGKPTNPERMGMIADKTGKSFSAIIHLVAAIIISG